MKHEIINLIDSGVIVNVSKAGDKCSINIESEMERLAWMRL